MTREEFRKICDMLSVAYTRYNCWKGKKVLSMYSIFENVDYEKCVSCANYFISTSAEAPSVADMLHFKPVKGEEEEPMEIKLDKNGNPPWNTGDVKLDDAIADYVQMYIELKHLRKDDEIGEKICADYLNDCIYNAYSPESLTDSICEAISNKSLKIEYVKYNPMHNVNRESAEFAR